MGGATHRDPWDNQGGGRLQGGKWANDAHESIVKGGNPSGGGPSKPIAQRWTL